MKFVNDTVASAMAMSESFQGVEPFPHIVIDDLFVERELRKLVTLFPRPDERRWWKYDNLLEQKFALNDLSQLDPLFRDFFHEVNSPYMTSIMEELSGVKDLIPDHTLLGGGLHQIVRGGKLDIHEDFNIHRELKAFRRLNMIVFLNDGWEEEWGGHLELWDMNMTKCAKKIAPVFNRAVIFRTDLRSNHGHPDPLACPEGVTRKSLAVYWYQKSQIVEATPYRSTSYKRRPQDPEDHELDLLREKRKRGRLTDETT